MIREAMERDAGKGERGGKMMEGRLGQGSGWAESGRSGGGRSRVVWVQGVWRGWRLGVWVYQGTLAKYPYL